MRVVVELEYEDKIGDAELVRHIGAAVYDAHLSSRLFDTKHEAPSRCEVSAEEVVCDCKGLGWMPQYCVCEKGQQIERA